MRARFINEGIEDILKPKSIKEIITNLNLDKDADINDILISAVESGQPAIIEYALQQGANQLWYESVGPMGGSRYSHAYESPALVRIVGVKTSSGGFRGFYERTPFKVVFEQVAYLTWDSKTHKSFYKIVKGGNGSSELFYRKYSPIDKSEIKDIEEKIEEMKELLKTINKLNKK